MQVRRMGRGSRRGRGRSGRGGRQREGGTCVKFNPSNPEDIYNLVTENVSFVALGWGLPDLVNTIHKGVVGDDSLWFDNILKRLS